MNSVHDMGGMHGLGPIVPEPEGGVFHHPWEGRVHALNMASPTRSNIDAGRHQRELIPGAEYLRMSYYEKWFRGLSERLVLQGLISAEEMAAGQAAPNTPKVVPHLPADAVAAALARIGSYVRDGAAPMFRGKPLAVVGGGDTAMEEALFLTKYGSKVHVIHRRDELRASKVMQRRALEHPKIEMVWSSACVEACGAREADGAVGSSKLGSIKVKNLKTEEVSEIECSGLFFAIGHEPASKFLDGQLELDADGYIATRPGTVETSVPGVFACGDVQDKKWRQAITAAGTGCMAALSAEHFLVEHGSAGEAEQAAEELARGAQVASPGGAAAAAAKKKAAGAEEEGVKERAVPSVAGKERVPA